TGVIVSPVVSVTALASVAVLLIGLADDRLHLNAKLKLLLLLAACGVMTWFGVRADAMQPWPGALVPLPLILALGGSILWLVVIINAVTFMDGATGLAMAMAAIAAAGFSACAIFADQWDMAFIAAALCAALAGFLVWNIPGRLFVGDAGALFAGAVLGGL